MASHPSLDRFRWQWLCGFCLVISMGLMGCADANDADRRGVEAVGSIAFSIEWVDAPEADTAPSRFACGTGSDEVAIVDAHLANAEHTINLADPWPCSDGQGTLTGIPVGSDYVLTISAVSENGFARYCVERMGITVRAGATTNIGTLEGYLFETSGHTPGNGDSDVDYDGPSFGWDGLAGAAGYRLVVSESADLSDSVHDEIHDGLGTTLATGLAEDTQYWWGVAPVDFDGRPGLLSADRVYRFTTLDPCPGGDDYGDYRETAVAILPDSTTAGAIECDFDEDYFRFELSGSRTVGIFTEGGMDTLGFLLDEDGDELDWDDDGGTDYNFYIEGTLSAGTYYVVVTGFEEETGGYTLYLGDPVVIAVNNQQ